MHARDYSPELAKIEGQFQAVRHTVKNFTELPVMVLTPENTASQIEAAGRDGRHADQQAWERARRDLQTTAATISGLVTEVRTGQKQKKRDTVVASVMLVVGLFLGGVGRDLIPWMAPVRWHWPEDRAAAILGRDKWSAGERLLEVADPAKWQKVRAAARSVEDQDEGTGTCAGQKANCAGSARAKGTRPRALE